jgi:hypothetical protein
METPPNDSNFDKEEHDNQQSETPNNTWHDYVKELIKETEADHPEDQTNDNNKETITCILTPIIL